MSRIIKFSCPICNIQFKTKNEYSEHIRKLHKMKLYDFVFKYIYNNEIPKCKCGCGEHTKYNRKKMVFGEVCMHHGIQLEKICPVCNKLFIYAPHRPHETCSNKCAYKLRRVKTFEYRKCACGNTFYVSKVSTQQFCSKSCPEIANHHKKTNLKRYGHESHLQSNEIKEKTKKTNLKKYGHESHLQSDEIKEKIKKTNLKLYGFEQASKNDEVKEKAKKTNLKKYGHVSSMQNKEIKDKANKTIIKKYGVKHTSQNKEIKAKIKQTNIERYGSCTYMGSEKYINVIYAKALSKLTAKLNIINIELLDNYIGYKHIYKFKCLTCNHEFEYKLQNQDLPVCRVCIPLKGGTSKAEYEIIDFIKTELHIENIIHRDKSIGIELDIYLPDYNVAIEHNGLYWHSEKYGKDKNYHLNKTLKCKNKGIQLIHIFEDEWMFKKDIVKMKLKQLLNIDSIALTDYTIKEIDSTISNEFLDQYHLLGSDKSTVRLGLYNSDDLVSVMTFKKKLNDYEINRFAYIVNDKDIMNNMIQYFLKQYNPNKLISFIDRRWIDEKYYESIGFKTISEIKPDYYYLKNCDKRIAKKEIKIELLEKYEPTFTEWENMQINGYDRIWDCGKFKMCFIA